MKKEVIGYIGLDDEKSIDSIMNLFSKENIEPKITKGKYTMIKCHLAEYFAQIINEPKHYPEHGFSGSPMNKYPILNQDKVDFVPSYMCVSKLNIIGKIEQEKLVTNFRRPTPASSVIIPDSQIVKKLLKVSGEHILGTIVGYEQDPITVALTDAIGRKQLGIFGITGSGKSNTALRVAEIYAKMGWCIIFLDYLDEYVDCDKASIEKHLFTKYWKDLGVLPIGCSNVKKFQPVSDIRERKGFIKYTLKTAFLDFGIIQNILCPSAESGGDAQARKLYPLLHEFKEQKRPIHLVSLSKRLDEEMNKRGGDTSYYIMKQRCDNLLLGNNLWDAYSPDETGQSNLDIFKKMDVDIPSTDISDLDPSEMLKANQINIISFKDVSESDYRASVLILLTRLYNLKKYYANGNLPKVMIFVEEAHIPFSEKIFDRYSKSLNEISRKIFKIGRHYHLNMCVISQRPNDISDAILSQANTRIIHRLKQRADIGKVVTGDIEDYWGLIPRLDVGEAIIDSIEFKAPLTVKVAPCCSKKIDPYME